MAGKRALANVRGHTKKGHTRTGTLTNWLVLHRQVAANSARRLLESPLSSLLTVFVIAVSLLLPTLLFTLNSNLNLLLESVQNNSQIALYLHDDITDSRAHEVSEDLLAVAGIEAVDYISRAQGLAEFSAASGLGEVLLQLPENPLPAAILVTPDSRDPAQIAALSSRLAARPEVELAQVDNLWLQRLVALSRLISVIGSGLGLIVITGLFVIVGNTIKLSIENRRREIRVIKLVGGTDSFIARPFLYSGLFYGSAGGILALVLQAIVLLLFNAPLQDLLSLYDGTFELHGMTLGGSGAVIALGAGTGWAAALLASLRHIWNQAL